MSGERISGKKEFSPYPILMFIFTLFSALVVQAGAGERFKSNDPDFIRRTGSVLKKFFRKSKDHYQIDGDIKKIVNAKGEWILEMESKNHGMVFRVNGVVRFKFRFLRNEGKRFVFRVNNRSFVMDHGRSYTNHKNRLLNLLNFRQSILESLFIKKADAFNEKDVQKVVEEKIEEAVNEPYETFTPFILGQIVVSVLDISSFGAASVIKYGFGKFVDATFGKGKKDVMDSQLQCIDTFNKKIRDSFLRVLMTMESGKQKKRKKNRKISVTQRLNSCLSQRDQLSHLLEGESFKNRFEDDTKSALAVYYLQYCNKYGGRNHRPIRSEEEPVKVRSNEVKCMKTRKPFTNFDWKAALLKERRKVFDTCKEVLHIKMKEYGGDWFNRGDGAFDNCYAHFHCAVAERLNRECTCRLPGYSCLIESGMRDGDRPSSQSSSQSNR